jgi:hypothetical protein
MITIRILCAAVHLKNNIVYPSQPINIRSGLVVYGYRHDDCFQTLLLLSPESDLSKTEAGFITSTKEFVSREEAALIAYSAKQLLPHINFKPELLISEHLY